MIQNEDISIESKEEDKLNALDAFEVYPISLNPRQKINDLITPIRKLSFTSLNKTIGWLGTTSIIICVAFSSLMHQQAPSEPVNQTVFLRILNKHGSGTSFVLP